jgi:putative ABC transport system ATP-binding protein
VALLDMDGVAISVGDRVLLSGLSLSLEAGERVAVVGPSGSGKTELLRAVAGLRDADTGTFALRGRSRESMPYPEWRRRVTYVTQRAVLLEGSVLDNLVRPFRYHSVGAEPDEAELATLVERLSLRSDVLSASARTLSVGEQQRVAFIRALAIRPDVLLLDEPTSALDPDATRALEELVRERDLTALVVSHDPAQRERLTHRSVEIAVSRSEGDDA